MAVVYLTILWHSTDKHVIVYVVGSANFSSRDNQFLELKMYSAGVVSEEGIRKAMLRGNQDNCTVLTLQVSLDTKSLANGHGFIVSEKSALSVNLKNVLKMDLH